MKPNGWRASTRLLCAVFLVVFTGSAAFSQDYPTKAVNLTVTFAPGGTLDASTRILALKAEKILGQPIVVNNVGGGGGAVALGQIAKKKNDGYELTSCTSTGLIRIPQLRAVPYSHEDFVPVMHFTSVQSGLVVKSDSEYKSVKDLIEFARKNPGKVTYGTPGAGSPMHMAMEFIGMKENIQWTHVPFTGGAPGVTALLGGHVTALSESTEWLPHVKDGTLRLLATHGEKRMSAFPDVPTLRELGYDFINETVFLIAAPKGTPPAVVSKLDAAFKQAMADPEFVKTIKTLEFEVTYRGAADTQAYLEDAYKRFGEMIQKLNIKKES
jgi:tripartite-type tricarboxylate transporter receptor subunit TctC